MEWVKDKTGRFSQRPYYPPDELDNDCEKIISEFLQKRYGKVSFPISTEDLTKLLEAEANDLDLYADLSGEAGKVEGDTRFFHGQKPKVRISRELSENKNMENRLRTTLTHEYGHVHFHGFIFELQKKNQSLFGEKKEVANQCKRDAIISASKTDWMEWQAGFICGSLLMPLSHLKTEIASAAKNIGVTAFQASSQEGQALIAHIAHFFQVSNDAARVRLAQRGIFSGLSTTPLTGA